MRNYGGGFVKKKIYKETEYMIRRLRQFVLYNGISGLLLLQDRVSFELPRIIPFVMGIMECRMMA